MWKEKYLFHNLLDAPVGIFPSLIGEKSKKHLQNQQVNKHWDREPLSAVSLVHMFIGNYPKKIWIAIIISDDMFPAVALEWNGHGFS